MKVSGRLSLAFALFLMTALGACSMAPRVAVTETDQSLPDHFEQASDTSQVLSLQWWHDFNDPALSQLVDTVLVHNLDLRMAAARISEVQNLYRITRASLWPGVQGKVERTEQSTPSNTGPTGSLGQNIPNFPDRFDLATYSASLGFSFEIDFWGRLRGAKDAALQEFFATHADRQTILLGILSETIATYLDVVTLDQQHRLSLEQIDLLAERLDLTRQRYERGLVSSFELYAVQQQLEQARATVPTLESQAFDARGRLNVLMGRYPETLSLGHPSDDLASWRMASIPAGLPSEMLQGRPDIVAAASRMEAARQRVGVARADRFPRFALTGTGGRQSQELSDLLKPSQHFWLFGGSLTAPLFQAGALRANERVAWARYEQSAARYEKTVLNAFREVESALKAYQSQQQHYAFLSEEWAAAQANALTQEQRFLRGVGNYIAYLDAQSNQVRVSLAVVASYRALALARLNIHRALGGVWVDVSENPQ